MKKGTKKPFKEIESEWYERLKIGGFQDIEDTSNPDRPLKEWHSKKFATERSRVRQAERENYNRMIDNFINSIGFGDICKLITRHGNSTLSPGDAKKILELHRNGWSQRKIANKLKCGKKCVHLTIDKAKIWMKLVS